MKMKIRENCVTGVFPSATQERRGISMSIGYIVFFSIWGVAALALWIFAIRLWRSNRRAVAAVQRLTETAERIGAKTAPK